VVLGAGDLAGAEITGQMELRWHGVRTLGGLFARATDILAALALLPA
jgi:hypothetical protein